MWRELREQFSIWQTVLKFLFQNMCGKGNDRNMIGRKIKLHPSNIFLPIIIMPFKS